jgi:hypothetical protein
MRPTLRSSLFAFAAVTLLVAEPDDLSWKDNAIPQWDVQDAKQVLTDSPWAKRVELDQVRNLSKFERRDSGNWETGIGPTVGFAALLGGNYEAQEVARAHARPDLGTVLVRWESASPIRAEEVKAGVLTDVPKWQGDYYVIAVHNIPTPYRWRLESELKDVAFLKRDKKKDLKPSRVEIIRQMNGRATVAYLFSRSAEITKSDHNVRFVAQIDRLFVSQFFFPEEIQLQGQPEL